MPTLRRKLEEMHQEKLAAVRSELMKEMDLIRQQAAQQCEELEAEVGKIKEDESFLRDHLSISVKVGPNFAGISFRCRLRASQNCCTFVLKGKQTSGDGLAGLQ